VRLGQRFDRNVVFGPPQPLAGRDHGRAEQATEDNAYRRAQQSRFDRVADEEQAAERECRAARPHGPSAAKCFLESFARSLRRSGIGRPAAAAARSRGGDLRHCRLLHFGRARTLSRVAGDDGPPVG